MSETKQTALEIAKDIFPEMTDAELQVAIWDKTGFPDFWRTNDPLSEFKKQLMEYKKEIEGQDKG